MPTFCLHGVRDRLPRVRTCKEHKRIDCVEGGLVEINKTFTSIHIIYDQILIFDSRFFKVSGAGA